MTICTPLLLEAVTGTVFDEFMVDEEGLRVTIAGRAAGVRGGMREGESDGNVLDRAIDDGLEPLLGINDLWGWKPARCSSADWPGAAVVGGRVGVVSTGESSRIGDNSESCRSGGGGVVRRLSSEAVDGRET